jgi:cyclic pyranopterin monophosphate synthase
VKLYAFDGIDQRLELLPLAARRALDLSGMRLSREGFLSLAHAERVLLTSAGGEPAVDRDRVVRLLAPARPEALAEPPALDPPLDRVPEGVTKALGPTRPLPDAVWSALTPLDRYALAKVCGKNSEDRVGGAYKEIVGHSALSSHVAPTGGVRMVDISSKPSTKRRASAGTSVQLGVVAYRRLVEADVPKGDVLGTARLAAILAAKRTSDLIPLCHPVPLTHVEVHFVTDDARQTLDITCSAETVASTGVEMEALVGASIAALTVYDMLKSIDRGLSVGPTRLLEKSGGRSGDFSAGSPGDVPGKEPT